MNLRQLLLLLAVLLRILPVTTVAGSPLTPSLGWSHHERSTAQAKVLTH